MAKRDSESAKFLAVGQPFQFRVAPPGMVDDEEGVLEDGKLMIGTEEPVEVTTLGTTTGLSKPATWSSRTISSPGAGNTASRAD
jgi:hypothetical protein